MIKKVFFKNIIFYNFNTKDLKKKIVEKKLFVFPSGYGLASIDKNRQYLLSLKHADYVFFSKNIEECFLKNILYIICRTETKTSLFFHNF